jgi:hypothetical protein
VSLQTKAEAVHRRLHSVQAAHQTQDERPLGSYVAVMGVYGGAETAAALLARATGRGMPARPDARNFAVLAIATHKATRLVTTVAVTSPLRAPFVRHTGSAGEGEVTEEVRAEGLGHSVGELLTCPFCASVWVATGLTAGTVLAPQLTRAATTVLVVVFGSEILNLLYDSAKYLPAGAEAAAGGG